MATALATHLTTLAEYVRRIELRKPNTKETYFYRGHSVTDHALQPSLFRASTNRKHERNILRELISIHPSEFSGDNGVFEQLVRMQHYSLPTRLLDITTNPLVALYFACTSKFTEDGEVIRITITDRRIKYYDSDTVSCLANLSHLSGNERDMLRRCRTDADVAANDAGRRLLQFIKSEKPYFLPQIVRSDLDGPLAVKPRLTNRRLLAQQGAFLLFGLKTSLSDTNEDGIKVLRNYIPAAAKRKIRDSLDRVGINPSTMFPEIESAAKYIMSKVTPASDDEIGA